MVKSAATRYLPFSGKQELFLYCIRRGAILAVFAIFYNINVIYLLNSTKGSFVSPRRMSSGLFIAAFISPVLENLVLLGISFTMSRLAAFRVPVSVLFACLFCFSIHPFSFQILTPAILFILIAITNLRAFDTHGIEVTWIYLATLSMHLLYNLIVISAFWMGTSLS